MCDDLCWCSFFLRFGIGGPACSNFVASTVYLVERRLKGNAFMRQQVKAEQSSIHSGGLQN